MDLVPIVVGADVLGGATPSCRERGSRGHSLQTVTVIGAHAAEHLDLGEGPGNRNVTHLRMQQTMDQVPVGHEATTDPRASRQIDHRVEAFAGTVAEFAEGGHIDVGVERHCHARQALTQDAEDVDIGPAGLGCRGHEPVRRRRGIGVAGAERTDADGGDIVVATEELHARRQVRGRICSCGEPHLVLDLTGRTHHTHRLGAAELDSAQSHVTFPR